MLNNCIKRMNANLSSNKEDTFFYHLFRNSMIGQVVVSKNLDILFANNQIFRCFQTKLQDTSGQSFGKAFHCIELRHGHKCGEAETCKNCGVWRSVREALFSDTPVQSVIEYSFKTGRRSIKKWFQLNSGKMTMCKEQYTVLVFVDISDMIRTERHLRSTLTLDLATGTLNKTSLMSALRQLMSPKKSEGNFTICMIDFDNFKAINDRYGHLMGDTVLEAFSVIARSHIRSSDMIGRYGGEEFIFVFYETDQRRSLQILKRIHRELEEYFSKRIESPVTFSAGVIYVESVNGPSHYTDLIGDVDKMLYRAKKRGRGRAMSSIGETLFTDSGLKERRSKNTTINLS